jgi:hypothetical protein
MSSSRRRGRPPGASATTQPPTVTATPAEVADALLAETPADKGPEPETDEPETAEVQAVEAAEQPADDAAAEAVEASGEPAPAEVQSAADDGHSRVGRGARSVRRTGNRCIRGGRNRRDGDRDAD